MAILTLLGKEEPFDLALSKQFMRYQEAAPSLCSAVQRRGYFVRLAPSAVEDHERPARLMTLLRVNDFGEIEGEPQTPSRSLIVAPQWDFATEPTMHLYKLVQDCGVSGVERIEPFELIEFGFSGPVLDSEWRQLKMCCCEEEQLQDFESLDHARAVFAQAPVWSQLQFKGAQSLPNSVSAATLLNAKWKIGENIADKTLGQCFNELKPNAYVQAVCHYNAAIIEGGLQQYLLPSLDQSVYQSHEAKISIVQQSFSHCVQRYFSSFGTLDVGYGVKPVACVTGFNLSDLNMPQHACPPDAFALQDEESVSALDIFVKTSARRSRRLSEAGVANIGGFVRTGLATSPQIQVQQYGLMRDVDRYLSQAEENEVKYILLGDRRARRAASIIISRCNTLEQHNPILKVDYANTEQFLLTLRADKFDRFQYFAQREGCPYEILKDQYDAAKYLKPAADVGPALLLEVEPPTLDESESDAEASDDVSFAPDALLTLGQQVLEHPSVADKRYLINHFDRSVGGLVARDQLVGHWQVPVCDVAVTLLGYQTRHGNAMAVGERSTLLAYDVQAALYLSFAEAITNLLAADVQSWLQIKLSLCWQMLPKPITDQVYRLIPQFCRWAQEQFEVDVVAVNPLPTTPLYDRSNQGGSISDLLSFTVHASAPVENARQTQVPRLLLHVGETELVFIDLSEIRGLSGSIFEQECDEALGSTLPRVDFAALKALLPALHALRAQNLSLAYHDVADGGLFAALAEMAFASRAGFDVHLDDALGRVEEALFSEAPGVVLQVREDDTDEVLLLLSSHGLTAFSLGEVNDSGELNFYYEDELVLSSTWQALQKHWSEVGRCISTLAGDLSLARLEYDQALDAENPGLSARLSFDPEEDVSAPFLNLSRPKAAVVRSSCSIGQNEMVAALHLAGFECVDFPMSELRKGQADIRSCQLLALGSGYSYGDVLGAGWGWAQSILMNPALKEQFAHFFEQPDTLCLGLGNGAQLLTYLTDIIPLTSGWPVFEENISSQFESRLGLVKLNDSVSVFTQGMAGSVLPIVTANEHGRAEFALSDSVEHILRQRQVITQYVDYHEGITETYPMNPTGSAQGICGVSSGDGRVCALMVHPERCFRSIQMSWHPNEWGEYSPWMRLFRNARVALG